VPLWGGRGGAYRAVILPVSSLPAIPPNNLLTILLLLMHGGNGDMLVREKPTDGTGEADRLRGRGQADRIEPGMTLRQPATLRSDMDARPGVARLSGVNGFTQS
jgi:hypothetical protein